MARLPRPLFVLTLLLSAGTVHAHPGHGEESVRATGLEHYLAEPLHAAVVLAAAVVALVVLGGSRRRICSRRPRQ